MENLLKEMLNNPEVIAKLKSQYENTLKEKVFTTTVEEEETNENTKQEDQTENQTENQTEAIKMAKEKLKKLQEDIKNIDFINAKPVSPEEFKTQLQETEDKMNELKNKLKDSEAFNKLVDNYISSYVIENKKEEARDKLTTLMTGWFIEIFKDIGPSGNAAGCSIM